MSINDKDYKPYIGNVGTVIEVDMDEDLTSFTLLKLYVTKQKKTGSGTEIKTWTFTQKSGDGNENVMVYTIIKDDLDIDGLYKCQPYGEISGWKGRGDSFTFRVYAHYE